MLVCGRPASGKTTLARHIVHRLKAPVISRDPITEALAEAFQRRSHEVSNPSFAVFWRLIHEQVDAGISSVAETNLHGGAAEPAVRALALVSDVRLVHCHTSRELSIRRFID